MLHFALLLSLSGALVVDGDTLKRDGQRYRLWGIDSPEPSEPGGPASTQALRAIIAGQTLNCDVLDVDQYGRPVIRCALPDGRDPACELIGQGHASDWPRYSKGCYKAC